MGRWIWLGAIACFTVACGSSGAGGGSGGSGGTSGSGGAAGFSGASAVTDFIGPPLDREVAYTPGSSLSIETTYGNVTVTSGGPPGTVRVTFQPFDYEAYDQKDLAAQNMNTGLDLSVTASSTITVAALRNASTSSDRLGAGVTVTLPSEFDGSIDVHNQGKGPLAGKYREFDVNLGGVAQANALDVQNDAALGATSITGAASVTSTTVNAHAAVTITGVADDVNITTDGAGLGDPGVWLVISQISAAATGGTVVAQSSSIRAAFPASANFELAASSPQGAVNEGTVPASCTLQSTGATAKTITCGSGGPLYQLTTHGVNDSAFQDGNIDLSYQ